jgi:molybdenum cofactor biosynthesis enzyme MoaA
MNTIVGIGFYRREQYPVLLETADDRNDIEETYDEWLKALKKGLQKASEAGVDPVKVDVDVYELLAYCQEHGLKNNAETRSQFFAELLRQGRWEKFENNFLNEKEK